MKLRKDLILIISISFFVAVINVLIVIVGTLKIPPGSAYLAVGHYFLDYFEYVQQIVQGMRGRWLVNNPFTPNDPTETFIGWGQYLIYGKIANLFHWSPYFTYWFIVFILSIILCLLLFQLIKQLIPQESFFFQLMTWLLSIFAAPFVKIFSENSQLKIVAFDFWYAPMSLFHRFGGVPHQLMITTLVAALLILLSQLFTNFSKLNWKQLVGRSLIITALIIFLLTFAPFPVISLISSLVVTGWIYLNKFLVKNSKKEVGSLILFLGLTLVIVLPAALIIQRSHDVGDLFKRAITWETAQFHYPFIWELLATTGPILIFVPFGIIPFLKQNSPLRWLFFFFTVFSYFYFYTPLALFFGTHNGRFLNPVSYVLFGTLTILGMKTVTGWLTKKRILFNSLVFAFLIYFLLVTYVIYRSFAGIDRLSYLPKQLISAIKLLDQYPDNKAVLTSPPLSLGLIVPAIVDRKVYLGRSIFTPDYEQRTTISDRFYRGLLPAEQAKKLIIDNNIGYVILAQLEAVEAGYQADNLEKYPFLKKIFENEAVKIYKVF